MTMRLAIRGFGDGVLKFEDRVDLEEHLNDEPLYELATKHEERLAPYRVFMIEIEFLDEPNEHERFLRFGTDRRGMVAPIALGEIPAPAAPPWRGKDN